jgi:hypothetical protein
MMAEAEFSTFQPPGQVIRPPPFQTFEEPRPGPSEADLTPSTLEMVQALSKICATRVLGLIAVVGAVAMFGFAVSVPDTIRTATVAAYAAVVLWPIIFLYIKKG